MAIVIEQIVELVEAAHRAEARARLEQDIAATVAGDQVCPLACLLAEEKLPLVETAKHLTPDQDQYKRLEAKLVRLYDLA